MRIRRTIEAGIGLGALIGVAAYTLYSPSANTIVFSSIDNVSKGFQSVPELSKKCSDQGVINGRVTERPLGLALGRITVDGVSGVYSLTIDSQAFYENLEDPGGGIGYPIRARIGRGTSFDLTLSPDGKNITDKYQGYLEGVMGKCNVLIATWRGGRINQVFWNFTQQKRQPLR